MSQGMGPAARQLGPLGLYAWAIAIGVVGAAGAVVFRGLIAVVHNLFFLGCLSTVYDTNVHTPPSPWGPWVILVPAVGALGVAFLVGNFAPEAKGHGVPEVMDAIYYHKGVIRPIVALVKSLASALSIGTGGSVVQGVGYATIQDVLSGSVSGALVVLCGLKLAATSITLGSGASGGIFSPALFLGATLGGAYGLGMARLFPGLGVDPVTFAVAGMAGLVGGATGAALTAIVMIFEMTRQYSDIIPITITVALGYGVRKALHRESIYTLKLARRGHDIPDSLQANFYHLKKVREVMDTHFAVLPEEGTPADLARLAADRPDVSCFVITGPDGPIGFLARDAAAGLAGRSGTMEDLADRRVVAVGEGTPLFELMSRLHSSGGGVGVVLAAGEGKPAERLRGVVTGERIASAAIGGLELFSEAPSIGRT